MRLFDRAALRHLLACIPLVLACAAEGSGDPGDGDDGEEDCTDGKCDDPGATADRECKEKCGGSTSNACFTECRDAAALDHCEARKSDAIDSAQKAFTPNNIRWACADVEGVNTNGRDDRGQEYCEYYAVVQPPPAAAGGALPDPVDLGRNKSSGSPTPLSLTLNEDQIFALEDEPDAIAGQCIFTSWHQDIELRYPVCGSSNVTCPKLTLSESAKLPSWQTSREYTKIPLTDEWMRMKVTINSNNAAADLFEKCLTDPPAGDASKPDDPLHDDYIRGCWKAYKTFKTEWRRSDPSVCAVGVRLTECGCGVDTNGDGTADITDPVEISRGVVPFQPDQDGTLRLRGFHLGTWSDMNQLPSGCRYLETGDTDSTKTLVACDLTASDVLSSQQDPKQKCREKYGDNVVVHVPVPAGAIVCTPPADGQYAATCSSMPWVVGGAPSGS
jgi:hypothetical protein